MQIHITRVCGSLFYHLYNIRQIRKFISRETTEKLVHTFISSRIDYCNSLLYGSPSYQINKLQRVQNAAAQLVCGVPKFHRITPTLGTTLASIEVSDQV